ncbi:MAG: helix-turn-helix domain-containing protein [Lewinella sp.]
MQFSFLSVLFLFGALQALLFMAGVWRKNTRHPISLRLLLLLLACIAVILAHHGIFMNLSGREAWHYSLMGLSAACWLAVPPALYLYVFSLVDEKFRWRRGYWGYFTVSIYHVISWLLAFTGFKYGFYLLFASIPQWYNFAWLGSYLVVAAIFGIGTLRLLAQGPAPDPQLIRLNWMRYYVIAFLVAIGISTATLFYMGIYTRLSEYFEFTLLFVFEVFVLALVYQSLRRSTYSVLLANRLYGATATTASELKTLHLRLEQYMEKEVPYLRPDLKLSELAKAVGATDNELSQLFTQHLVSNFYSYVNGYRLAAFENALGKEENAHLSINGLAIECGFKSKTSLYKVFRQKHGTTPVAFLKAQAQ